MRNGQRGHSRCVRVGCSRRHLATRIREPGRACHPLSILRKSHDEVPQNRRLFNFEACGLPNVFWELGCLKEPRKGNTYVSRFRD
jgi:hypothetical protein